MAKVQGRGMPGWKGNVLGLARFEVEIAHDQAHTIRIERIERDMLAGKDFWTAKQAALDAKPWKYHSPLIAEAIKRIVEGFEFSDISRETWRVVKVRHLASIEANRGYAAGRLERLFYRVTGLVWSIEPKGAKGR